MQVRITAKNDDGTVGFELTPDIPFSGWIQADASFDHALTAEEVLRHYEGQYVQAHQRLPVCCTVVLDG